MNIFLIIIVILFCQQSQANTYYIDNLIGNDQFSGLSQEVPWKSIKRINSFQFSPGDKVLFHRGQDWYNVSIRVKTSDLLISSYGEGDLPRLIGAIKHTQLKSSADGMIRIKQPHEWGIQLVLDDRGQFYKWLKEIGSGMPPSSFYYDAQNQNLIINPSPHYNSNKDSFLIGNQNHIIELQNIANIDLEISNIEISYANRYGVSPWWQGGKVSYGSVNINNSIFVGNSFSAICFSGNANYKSILINNNLIEENGAEGIYIGPYTTLENLEILNNRIGSTEKNSFGWRGEGPTSAFVGDGIDVKYGNIGVIIKENIVTNIRGGYGIGIQSSGSVVTDNLVSDVYIDKSKGDAGIFVDILENNNGTTLVSNNRVRNKFSHGIVIRGSTDHDPKVLIENNEIIIGKNNNRSQIGLLSMNNTNITLKDNKGDGGTYGVYLFGEPPNNLIIKDNQLLNTENIFYITPNKLQNMKVKNNIVCNNHRSLIEWRTGQLILKLDEANRVLGINSIVITECGP